MNRSIKMEIKAILFGVDESVVGVLNIGNDYKVKKDSLANSKLWKEFEYTAFGLRRVYEDAVLNNNLDVAILSKSVQYDFEVESYEELDTIITKLETDEMNYIDMKMRVIRLYSENGFNVKELLINICVVNEENQELYYDSKIPFPDTIYNCNKKLSLTSDEEILNINNFIKNIDLEFSKSQFESNLLKSACFLYDQSYCAPVATLRFMVCVIGLESLLVDGKSELIYRLSRNCAMLLSENSEEYKIIYDKVHRLYELRSDFVHNGFVKKLEEDDEIVAREVLRKVIFKIIEKNMRKEKLIKELDLKGYIT